MSSPTKKRLSAAFRYQDSHDADRIGIATGDVWVEEEAIQVEILSTIDENGRAMAPSKAETERADWALQKEWDRRHMATCRPGECSLCETVSEAVAAQARKEEVPFVVDA